MKRPFHITSCCHTHPGRVRSHNEDTCLANTHEGCFLVADGMGGVAAGEVASNLTKQIVEKKCTTRDKNSSKAVQQLVLDCLHAANAQILEHVQNVPSHKGMGCTAELLVFSATEYYLGHVGDSRSYKYRDGALKQLTTDHTLVQVQEAQGVISQEEAKTHSMKNIILRAVGNSENLEVDLIKGDALAGDMFLLCTDGLTAMVSDEMIKEILAFNGPLDLKATMLVDQANHAGGKDNVSVVLVGLQ